MSVTVLAVRIPVDICPLLPWSAAAFFLPMRAASGVKNGAVTVSDADVCCFRFSPEVPEDAATNTAAVVDLSRLPPLPVRDDDDALLRFRLRWLPFPEAAAAEATALATAVAVGPPCIVIPSSLSSPKKPPDVDRGLVGATIQMYVPLPCL